MERLGCSNVICPLLPLCHHPIILVPTLVIKLAYVFSSGLYSSYKPPFSYWNLRSFISLFLLPSFCQWSLEATF